MVNKTEFKTKANVIECRECKKLVRDTSCYMYRDKNKGKVNCCKTCLTKDIVNTEPDTFIPLLKELGYPYIEPEWNDRITVRKAKDKMSYSNYGQKVFGDYLVCMQRSQYKDFTFEESDKALEVYNSMPEHNINTNAINNTESKKLIKSPDATFISESEINLEDDLTLEDKKYLATKWGTIYTPNEWVQLEKQYQAMDQSFPIEDAGREGDLKMVCKVYMKANQALEAQDYKSFKELMTVYEKLMKSGKFTAAQNKENGDNQINSAAELVMLCEKEKGFIPKFCTDIPQDKVDFTLENMKEYLKNLVMKDLGFGKSLENAIKKLEKDLEKKNKPIDDDGLDADLGEDFKARRKNIYEELQKRIEEETKLLEEPESDDFLKEFVKEEGDDIPYMGEEEPLDEEDGDQ